MAARRSAWKARVDGFTLLETLLALGVFALAALGLMLALQSAIDAAATLQREGRIRSEIESRLARLSVGELHAFHAETNSQGVTFVEEVKPEKVLDEQRNILPGFWQVRVQASWTDRGQPQTWEVSHLGWQR